MTTKKLRKPRKCRHCNGTGVEPEAPKTPSLAERAAQLRARLDRIRAAQQDKP